MNGANPILNKRFMRLWTINLALLILLSLLAGCGSSKKLTGKWYLWNSYKGEMGQEYDKAKTLEIEKLYDLYLEFVDDHTLNNCLIRMTDVKPVTQEIKIEGNQIYVINKVINPNNQEYEKYATFRFRDDTLEIAWESLPGQVHVFKKVKRSE